MTTGDGALGFWKALDEIWPTTRHQRTGAGVEAIKIESLSNALDALLARLEGGSALERSNGRG